MPETTRLGLSIVGTALVLGVWGDVLRAIPLGVNVVLWIGALLLAGGVLARWQHVALTGEGRWCVWPALFFAAAFAWRDSATLQSVNGLRGSPETSTRQRHSEIPAGQTEQVCGAAGECC